MTGPYSPLTVARCLTHGIAFTLYPHGQVPYGRAAIAPVAPDGRVSIDDVVGAAAFAGTVFDAALDASRGSPWPRDSRRRGCDGYWSKQATHLDYAAHLTGIAPAFDDVLREAMAGALRVDLLLLRDATHAFGAATTYRDRGAAVCAVLERLAGESCLVERLAAAGHLAGLWGAPFLWDSTSCRLRRWSFRGLGTHPP